MTRATYRNIRSALKKAAIPVAFYRGEGYHYIEFDNRLGGADCLFGSISIMVPYLHQMTLERWVELIGWHWRELDEEHEGRFSAWVAAQQQENEL